MLTAFISVVFTQTLPQRQNLSSASGRCTMWFRSRKHWIHGQEAWTCSLGKKERIKQGWKRYGVRVPKLAWLHLPCLPPAGRIQKRSGRVSGSKGQNEAKPPEEGRVRYSLQEVKKETCISPENRDCQELVIGTKGRAGRKSAWGSLIFLKSSEVALGL